MSLFSDAHASFRTRVRRFVEDNLTPNADEWEKQQGFPVRLFREMGEQGFLGLTHARKYGGQELDFAHCVVLAEELPRSRMMGLSLSVLVQTNFFLPLLATLGTEEQKSDFLAASIRGEKIGALAATEPTGGSDLTHAVRCTAVSDGDSWVVTGEKKYITNGPVADFVIALVRTKPESTANSLSLLIIPTDTPGFRVKESLRKLGMHTSPTGWLVFDHCRVGKQLTLGKVNVGYFYLTQNLLEERLLAAACAVAAARLVLDDTIDYLRRRIAYERPLSQLQAVRHRVSEIAAEVEMAQRFVHSVAENFRDGKVEAKEICMIKFQVIDIVQRNIERCLQLHGGYGFLEENWISRVYRDARVLSLGGGVSELMKDLVANYLRL